MFVLQGDESKMLFETYHGVYVNIQYFVKVYMKRGLLIKDLDKSSEFVIEYSVPILTLVTIITEILFLLAFLISFLSRKNMQKKW